MTRAWNRGSEWRRWDPHLHTPGTLLNNQYADDWEGFLSAIENAAPAVDALGITDYCVLRGYQRFMQYRAAGRAANVSFVFPNIEFRLGVETKAGKGVNVHLLFSPEHADHVEQIERVLSEFKFAYKDTPYPCSPAWLIKLGRAINPKLTDDEPALRYGAEQFKLDWDTLCHVVKNDPWARDNCLLAISAHSNDGVSGLKHDGSFEAVREELKAQPNIIFSANSGDRDFFLGKKSGFDRDFIEATYGSLKPCLHGSDAHRIADVLKPADDRLCWIRADASFTGLKQTLIEPELRVAIGALPPPGPSESECIRTLEVSNAPWLGTASITLNDGLVAIVGPKGSGKTALADIIARAAGATLSDQSSFLLKAHEHLGDASATLHWADGSTNESRLDVSADEYARPNVRYLSQQFVDRLCSSDQLGGELLEEIESVVFQAIAEEDRLGTASFEELRALRLQQVARSRRMHLDTIERLTGAVADEDDNKARLPALQRKLGDLKAKIEKDDKELGRLLPKDKKAEVTRLATIAAVIDAKTKALQALALQTKQQDELGRDYALLREEWLRELDELRNEYSSCGLEEDEWGAFAPTFPNEESITATLAAAKARTEKQSNAIRNGVAKDDKDFTTWPLKDVQALQTKLAADIGVEKERGKKHGDLSRQLALTKQERDTAQKEIGHIKGASERRQKAITGRRKAYAAVFDTFVQEESLLNGMYAPLKARLAAEADVERRLELHVRRNVDVDAWVGAGEDLLDLRKTGPFHGHGGLRHEVKQKLAPAWRSGGADEVATAMEDFINIQMGELLKARRADVSPHDLGRWLFSTDHVTLEYGLQYEGVDLAHLSPGMRGIVLLILYLAIDQWDLRPLLVDQPEENLDPYSVYQELVRYFRAAKRRRQVIIVTHNPNLVVNADADQVIVAAAERKDAKSLPVIRYDSGGLEDRLIRSDVCRILEGGERAFLERERRYSIPRDRRTATR